VTPSLFGQSFKKISDSFPGKTGKSAQLRVAYRTSVFQEKYFGKSIPIRLYFEKLPVNSGRMRIIQLQNLPGSTLAVNCPIALG
jgi:hypothetical protein